MSVKTSCEIIRDILPLYHDGVCSGESRALVDEHIKDCPECAEMLKALAEEMSNRSGALGQANALNEAEPIKAIKARWEKGRKKALLKGAIIAVLACALAVGGYYALFRWYVVLVSASDIEVIGTYAYPDGHILCVFNVPNYRYRIDFTSGDADNSYYIVPKNTIIRGRQSPLEPSASIASVDTKSHSSAYLGAGKNAILLWEEGMVLPPVPGDLKFQVFPGIDITGEP